MPFFTGFNNKSTCFSSEYLIISGFLILYLLFPTSNSSLDSWGYACSVKYGTELFIPHHLLYNAFLHFVFISKKLLFPFADALETCKQVNGIFAAATLFVFYKILKLQVPDRQAAMGWLIFAGSTFGVLRFATENETYIIPLFFSVWGTYYLIRGKYMLSGFLLALACLFHQVHVLWWLACVISLFISWEKRKLMAFLLPAITVPLIYSLVIVLYNKQELSILSFFSFIFSDYLNGNAEVGIDFRKALLLTPISFGRTFIQVHGNTFSLLKDFPFILFLPCILLLTGFLFIKNLRFNSKSISTFQIAMGLAFILHFAFAAYSAGNAEFMVMLPMLLILAAAPKVDLVSSQLKAFGLSILAWNICVGLFPSRYFDLKGNKHLLEHIHNHPSAAYVLNDYWNVYNQHVYQYGTMPGQAISFREMPACEPCFLKMLNEKLENDQPVFTDCIKYNKVLDRSYLMDRNPNENFWDQYALLPEDTLNGKWNKTILYQIKRR